MTDSQISKPPHPDDTEMYSLEAIAKQLLPSVNQIFQITADLQSESADALTDGQKRLLQQIEPYGQLMLLMLTDPRRYHDAKWKDDASKVEYFDYHTCDARMRIATVAHDGNTWLAEIWFTCDVLLNNPKYFTGLSENQRTSLIEIDTLARNIINKMREMGDQITKLYKGNQP
jgi:hypothetical protein